MNNRGDYKITSRMLFVSLYQLILDMMHSLRNQWEFGSIKIEILEQEFVCFDEQNKLVLKQNNGSQKKTSDVNCV